MTDQSLEDPTTVPGLAYSVGRLESKIDLLLADKASTDARLRAIENIVVPRSEIAGIVARINALELIRARTVGGIAAISACASAAGGFLFHLLSHLN